VHAKPVMTEDVVEGAVVDAEEQDVAADLIAATIVGRLDPSSKVRPDGEVELAVDTEKLQFFDLETGFAI